MKGKIKKLLSFILALILVLTTVIPAGNIGEMTVRAASDDVENADAYVQDSNIKIGIMPLSDGLYYIYTSFTQKVDPVFYMFDTIDSFYQRDQNSGSYVFTDGIEKNKYKVHRSLRYTAINGEAYVGIIVPESELLANPYILVLPGTTKRKTYFNRIPTKEAFLADYLQNKNQYLTLKEIKEALAGTYEGSNKYEIEEVVEQITGSEVEVEVGQDNGLYGLCSDSSYYTWNQSSQKYILNTGIFSVEIPYGNMVKVRSKGNSNGSISGGVGQVSVSTDYTNTDVGASTTYDYYVTAGSEFSYELKESYTCVSSTSNSVNIATVPGTTYSASVVGVTTYPNEGRSYKINYTPTVKSETGSTSTEYEVASIDLTWKIPTYYLSANTMDNAYVIGGAVTDVSVASDKTTAKVTWGANYGKHFTCYLYDSTATNQIASQTTDDTSCTFTGLTPGETYNVIIHTNDDNGNMIVSNGWTSFTTVALYTKGLKAASATKDSILVKWEGNAPSYKLTLTQVLEDNTSETEDKEDTAKTDQGAADQGTSQDTEDQNTTDQSTTDSTSATDTTGTTDTEEEAPTEVTTTDMSYKFTGLVEKTTYKVTVQALDDNGIARGEAREITPSTIEETATVTDLVSSDITTTTVKLTWKGEAASYNVYLGDVAKTVKKKSVTITDLDPDTEYTFRVVPVKSTGAEKGDGETITVKTEALPTPEPDPTPSVDPSTDTNTDANTDNNTNANTNTDSSTTTDSSTGNQTDGIVDNGAAINPNPVTTEESTLTDKDISYEPKSSKVEVTTKTGKTKKITTGVVTKLATKKNLIWNPSKSNKVTVKWSSKGKKASSYRVEIVSVTGKQLATYTTKKKQITIKNKKVLKAIKNKGFVIRVACGVKYNGRTVYGKMTNKAVIPQANVKIVNKTKKTVTLSWKPVYNAMKYTIVVKPSKKGAKTVKKSVDGNVSTLTIANTKSGTVYIIPTVSVGGKKVKAVQTWKTSFNTK